MLNTRPAISQNFLHLKLTAMPLLQIDFTKIPVWIIIVVLMVFIALLAIAIITGREVSFWPPKIGSKSEKSKEELPAPIVVTHPDQPIVGIDKFLNEAIQVELIRTQTLDLINELKNLKTSKSALFQEAISIDFSEFLNEVKNWTRSSVKIQGSENDNFLIKLYRSASQSVFSTCLMDYFDAWKSDFGEKLLEAHKNNKQCKTTRIFIFHSKEDITEEAKSMIRKQRDYDVIPMILVDALNEFNDFTIIDKGEVIGLTNEMKFGKR